VLQILLQALAFIMLVAVAGAYTPLLLAAQEVMAAAARAVLLLLVLRLLQVLERPILAAVAAVEARVQTVVLAARAL
jgi:hypothetical protein